MKLVHADEVEWKRGLEHRGGTFHYRHLLEGKPGTPGNFHLGIGQQDGDFVSPRHRHNFDQFRFQLEGTSNFDRNGKMTPGILGYFPEGAAYGPQSSEGRSVTAVLQFGGASGSGYLSNRETRAAMEELKQLGEFKDGVFRRKVPFHGKKNADGNQAIWEHHHQRPIVFPKPRYPQPLMMDPRNYAWVPVEDAPGVHEKLLGVFTERRTEAGLYKLDPGAAFTAKGRGVFLVLRGAGTVAGEPIRPLTTLHLDWQQTATFAASTETEIMHFGLPNLAGVTLSLDGEREDDAAAVAAE